MLADPRECVLTAPAKINLRLKVLGRRADGYHLLSMLNVSSSLSDELRVSLREGPGVEISIEPEQALSDPVSANTVARVWAEFWSEFSSDGPPCGVSVVITKRIPIGAGLGGGSSDAAAMLRFIVDAFGKSICRDIPRFEFEARVMQVALRVGADVPYAYRGGVCWVTGIGDEVKLLNSVVSWPGEVLITKPLASVPTVDFYRFFREQHPTIECVSDDSMERLLHLSRSESAFRLEACLALIENDFECDVVAFRPEVGDALTIGRSFFPQTTSLTGSGAAIFSLVPNAQVDLIPEYISSMESAGMTVHRATI